MKLPFEPARFRPRLLDHLPGYGRTQFQADLGAGLTVGIVALPLAMAFAIASGLKPEAGLFTAIIAGLIVSALGGSSVQISGPAGAFIVVVYGIVERYGYANLLIATMLAGVMLFALGWLRLGQWVRLIPLPIVIGFTNGIAVLIAVSQLKEFFGFVTPHLPADVFNQVGVLAAHVHTFNPAALAIAAGSLALLFLWPRLGAVRSVSHQPGLRFVARLPGAMVVLVLATALVAVLGLPVETIGSRFGGIPQSLPMPSAPELSWTTAKMLLIPALTIALLAAIESLLCARVADNLSDAPRHDPNQELMAQGISNVVTPWFGGMPSNGTIARTVTNVRAGAVSPVSGLVHAATLLLIVLVAAPLAEHIPLAALAGILMFIAWNMGEWREFARLRHFNLAYRTILLGTFALTVIFDLTVAVEVGLVLACLFFIVRMGQVFRTEDGAALAAEAPPDTRVLRLYGALFFGAVGRLEALHQQPPGTRALVLEMHRLILIDTSGIDALAQLQRELARQGISLWLAAPGEQPLDLMRRSGFTTQLGETHIAPSVGEALQRMRAADAA